MAGKFGKVALGALLACLLLELLFRVLPVSTSTSMDYYVDARILNYPPHHRFVAASGWDLENARHLRANNAGFVASRDFSADPNAIALIGDSFVEASMLAGADRLDSQIERRVARPVYAMGGPGSSLLDYAERVRFASTKYSVRDFVLIIEEGDVIQAICGSGQVHGSCYEEQSATVVPLRQPSAGTLKRIARHSALAQFFTSQLKLDPASLLAAISPRTVTIESPPAQPDKLAKTAEFERIVDAFLTEVARYRPAHLVLVLEDRTVSGSKRSELQQLGRDILTRKGRAAGALLIDTGPVFAQFTRKTGLSVAVSPRDHHWNRAATALVADQVAQALHADPGQRPGAGSAAGP